jgi:uncharacterized damage-inducible protein DinB
MKSAIASSMTALCVCCLLFSTSSMAGMVTPLISDDSVKAQLVRDWQRAKVYTKAYLDAMPDDGVSFKPTPEIRSFAEQMLHLSSGTINLISAGTGKTKIYDGKNLEKSDELKTKAALSKVVMECYDYAIDAVNGLDASKLGEQVKMGNNSLSRLTLITKAFEHQTHHRGQCTIYLRLKGVTPPNEMLF